MLNIPPASSTTLLWRLLFAMAAIEIAIETIRTDPRHIPRISRKDTKTYTNKTLFWCKINHCSISLCNKKYDKKVSFKYANCWHEIIYSRHIALLFNIPTTLHTVLQRYVHVYIITVVEGRTLFYCHIRSTVLSL